MRRPNRLENQRGRSRRGFSLVEVVTVMALTGILAVGLGNLLQHPLNGYVAVSRRAELVSMADVAIGRLTRDLRQALPNSIRVSASGEAVELLHTASGARYRREPGINDPGGPGEVDHTNASDWLSFGDDRSWNLLGRLDVPGAVYGTALPAGTRLSIYPTGATVWSEAASNTSPASISPATVSVTLGNDGDEDQIRLGADHRFPFESPTRRLFLVDTPVSFVCDLTLEGLFRIDGYTVSATQPSNRATAPLAGGSSARMSDHVESCQFTYDPGTASRAGVVSIEIVLEEANERVRLLQQVQIANAP